jgi:superfamily II DNA helicase RecQ
MADDNGQEATVSDSCFEGNAALVLQQFWGYNSFREPQLEVIKVACNDERPML